MVNLLLLEIVGTMPWYVKLSLIFSKVFILYAIYGAALLIFNSFKLVSSYLNTKKYEVDMNCALSIDEANKILDTIIQDTLNSYVLMNGIALEDYITEDIENSINRDVSDMVASIISGALVNKLSMIFDINSLSDIISRKIFILTASFTIEKNKKK